MMNTKELDFLRSEVATLKGFLTSLPSSRIIERMGLEYRLEDAEARLAEVEGQPLGKPLAITFRGAPVDGMRSIDAGFGATALKAFIKATDTVAASLGADELKERGRLPAVMNRSLRIVDTAHGSFGFELELPPIEEPAQGELSLTSNQADPYAHAIEETFALIAEATESDDEAISDRIADMHPRAAATVQAFAKILADNDAGFAAEFEGSRVRLNCGGEVQKVLDALRGEDISERDEQYVGKLIGVLPESRRFECRLEDGRLLSGKVARSVPDINQFKQKWDGRQAMLLFQVISVRTNERLVLTGAEDIPSGLDRESHG